MSGRGNPDNLGLLLQGTTFPRKHRSNTPLTPPRLAGTFGTRQTSVEGLTGAHKTGR